MLFEEPHTSNKALAVEITMVVLLFICLITLIVDLGVSSGGGLIGDDMVQQLKQMEQLNSIKGMDHSSLLNLPNPTGEAEEEEQKGAWWMGNSAHHAANPPVIKEMILFVIEAICMLAFTVEYVCRLLASPVTV